jgi:hypothetical protein
VCMCVSKNKCMLLRRENVNLSLSRGGCLCIVKRKQKRKKIKFTFKKKERKIAISVDLCQRIKWLENWDIHTHILFNRDNDGGRGTLNRSFLTKRRANYATFYSEYASSGAKVGHVG